MRITFHTKEFIKFCRENGAKFFENGDCVWIDVGNGDRHKLAIALREDGYFYFGDFDNKCKNFEIDEEVVYSSDSIDFILKTLNIFKKWDNQDTKKI